MSVPAPHFLLYSHATRQAGQASSGVGQWRFELRRADGQTAVEASDEEACDSAERLELLAIVRGLEALDQPSRVTLVTTSRGIRSGMKYGLAQWRDSDWLWERYGKMSPVKNDDLWRRIDRALEIHDVRCREGALDSADDLAEPLVVATPPAPQFRRTQGGRQLRIDPPAANARRPRHPRQPLAGSRRRSAATAWLSQIWSRLRRRSAAD